MVVQVVTQSDRQEVSLFKNGAFQTSYLVPKPAGVRDGFFRLAELRDAQIVEGDVAVLLYVAPGSSDEELPLVLALDLKTKDIRWIHRALGERLALSDPPDAVAYLYGPKVPPVRLPLALANNEHTSPVGSRSAAKTIELTPEILEISDLRPTGAWTFLLAHKGGLSTYRGSKGWQHHPVPDGNPGLFKDVPGVFGGNGKKFWWQPYPGVVTQVLGDGTPKATWSPEQLTPAEPFRRDASLLHLLGADADGKLWFDLAVPTEPVPVEPAPGTSTEPQWKPENPAVTGTEAPVAKLEDWPTYVNQGLDRIYCWDTQKKTLQRFKWAALAVPPGFAKPANGVKLLPVSGALLRENGPSAWLMPLSALAFGESAATGKPVQAK
jgi:hypothetical protein